MANIRLYRNEQGYAHAETEESYEQVAWFLGSDIQGDSHTCRSYLDVIRRVRAGELKRDEGNGNSQNVIITTDSVTLQDMYLDHETVITLDQFEQAIQGWLDFLTSGVAESFIEL